MKRLKPLIASLATIAVALLIVLVWGLMRGKPAQRNTPDDTAPSANHAPTGLLYEETTLESRPLYDPPYVWPDDGMRMSSGEFWVMWQTREFSKCRLLGTKNQRLWYDLGTTGGTSHYLKVDLGFFESRVTFAIDFTQDGESYRSRPRTVSFGKGANFAQRQYAFTAEYVPVRKMLMAIEGRNPVEIPNSGYRHGWFPDNLSVGYAPQPGSASGGEVLFAVANPDSIPDKSCVGWVQVFDELAVTYDRTIIKLSKRQYR